MTELTDALAPTAYIDSESPAIIDHARRFRAGGGIREGRRIKDAGQAIDAPLIKIWK